MKIFALGRVKQIVEEACRLDVTHYYEDLVFVEHSPFLIRFDQDDTRLFHLYFNREIDQGDRRILFNRLQTASGANEMKCEDSGSFEYRHEEGKEELTVQFFEKALTP